MSVDHTEPFDFRSSRFCTDALTLARATGKKLQSCRQELFIAEGDMGLAYELLASGYEGEPVMRLGAGQRVRSGASQARHPAVR